MHTECVLILKFGLDYKMIGTRVFYIFLLQLIMNNNIVIWLDVIITGWRFLYSRYYHVYVGRWN